jgi:hypothetical protein
MGQGGGGRAGVDEGGAAEVAAREREGRATSKREGEIRGQEKCTTGLANEMGGKKMFGEEARKSV